jgi:AcrR family transcriptional regulator
MAATATNLVALAFDPRVEAPDDALSERILDAALDLAAASGIKNLTMDDVAKKAGVGRMTVYRRFGEKQNLVDTLGVREVRRCIAALDAAASPDEPFADQVAAGFVTSLRLIREHPLLARLARVDPEALLSALRDDDGLLMTLTREYAAARGRAAQQAGLLDKRVDVATASELIVRLMFSFVLIEDTVLDLADERKARALAKRMVAPMLVAS